MRSSPHLSDQVGARRSQIKVSSALGLYLQQCDGERDLETIGRDSVTVHLTPKADANGGDEKEQP